MNKKYFKVITTLMMAKLLDRTIELLQDYDITALSEITGFSYQWLWQIKTGKTKNPSISKIEKLLEYLESNEQAK